MSEAPPPVLTRRAVLGNAVGLATAASLTATPITARPTVATPTVVTRNAYLGVDLFRLFRADSTEAFRRIAGELLEEVDPALYEARADAITAEIAATEADVVALQEVALLRRQRPGDFGSDDAEPASTVLVDLRSLLESALDDRDLDYGVAAATTTTDVELPAQTDDGRVDVRLTDRDLLLVRDGVETGDAVSETFQTSIPIPLPESDRVLALRRGYCAVDVTVGDVEFTAVSAHLESVSSLVRRQQAGELLDALPDDLPVLLGGDFNSGPGTEPATYDRLTTEFEDAYAVLESGDGPTCCQASSLRNDRSRLDRRIDALLYRGSVTPTDVGRVGHRPEDRVEVEVDGETVRIWPSDHAGVVGTFEVAASTPTATTARTTTDTGDPSATATATTESKATATATRTRARTPSPGATATESPTEASAGSTSSDGAGPGMGALTAVVGLLAAVVTWLRRG